jgi:transposase
MVTLMKRMEIQVLRRAGHSLAEVAKFADVSRRTVIRVGQEATVTSLDDAAERVRRGVGRPSTAEPFREFVAKVLQDEPAVMSLEILRRARLTGYTGGKTALYALVASARPPASRLLVRFEGLPGEFAQHDFGEVEVRFVGGTVRRVHFFVSKLKWSRWPEVTLVPNQQVETLCRTLVAHYEAFGGVPLLSVFDRPATIVHAWKKDGTVTDWNQTFAQVMLELGVGIELCWPGRGQEKGAAENLVKWVKGSFFKQRRFVDDEDLTQQLAEWHGEVQTKIPCRETGVTPAARMDEERQRLRPLKVTSETLALRIPIYVGPTAFALHDTRLYSMPPEAMNMPGTLFLYRDRVRIVAGKYTTEHRRLAMPHTKSVLPAHRAAHVAAVSGKRGKRYLKRQQLLDLGDAALWYLTEITHRRPRAWSDEVEQLHDLLQAHGAEALRAAFARAVDAETFGAEYVKHYLRPADAVARPAPARAVAELER